MLPEYLENDTCVLVNNTEKVEGGAYTRYEPNDPNNLDKMSCLYLTIVSERLYEYREKLKIYEDLAFTPWRLDHFSFLLTFKNIQLIEGSKDYVTLKYIRWNLKRRLEGMNI